MTTNVVEMMRERVGRSVAEELARRMLMPQRHRLLHGYPLTRAMAPRPTSGARQRLGFDPRSGRELLVGVLPHPYCNPRVAGCGFCTFPHQKYQVQQAGQVVESVIRELRQRVAGEPGLGGRRVAALYFGGGTANLTPPDAFRRLCRELAAALDLSGAEVTLEGVPVHFLRPSAALLDIMGEELPARQLRISMGIQTFDPARLERMGRTAFGDAATFRAVVKAAERRGFTASADLLFNLPDQSLEEMRADLRQAMDIGLSHLGLYHLVLFQGLGTEWSRDPDLVAGVPDHDQAERNAAELRATLLASGFRQTTLTNFERAELEASERRFVYEEKSFSPERVEVLGLGPGGISFVADGPFASAFKTLNPVSATEYASAVARDQNPWSLSFDYDPWDMRVLYLTRRLAALSIDSAAYAALFRSELEDDFAEHLTALGEAGLIERGTEHIRPTRRGMFYADAIAGTLAYSEPPFPSRPGPRPDRGNGYSHM